MNIPNIRIFIEMIERIFVRFQTNISFETNISLLLLATTFLYSWKDRKIYNPNFCVSILCLIHTVTMIKLL